MAYFVTHTHTHTPSAQTMVDLGKDKQEADNFVRAMNEHFGEFQFPEEFIMDVWTFYNNTTQHNTMYNLKLVCNYIREWRVCFKEVQ